MLQTWFQDWLHDQEAMKVCLLLDSAVVWCSQTLSQHAVQQEGLARWLPVTQLNWSHLLVGCLFLGCLSLFQNL